MTNIFAYDSVASSVTEWRKIVPTKTPAAIGSYRNGRYANNTSAKQAFPKAIHYDYDVNGSEPESCLLDIEPGNVAPPAFRSWLQRWHAAGPHVLSDPGGYGSASIVSQIITVALDAGFKRNEIIIQSAHYAGFEHICGPGQCQYPKADGTQFADKGVSGQNTDRALWELHCFGKAPKPKYDPHYAWFDNTKRAIFAGGTEVGRVKEYDKWRAMQTATSHPHKARLLVLRAQMLVAAVRLSKMTELAPYHRQWRERELRDRANGHRFV